MSLLSNLEKKKEEEEEEEKKNRLPCQPYSLISRSILTGGNWQK